MVFFWNTEEFILKKEYNKTHCNMQGCEEQLPTYYRIMGPEQLKIILGYSGLKHYCPKCQGKKIREIANLTMDLYCKGVRYDSSKSSKA